MGQEPIDAIGSDGELRIVEVICMNTDAIGKGGKNVRLTSRLLGWRLEVEEFKTTVDDPRATAISSLTKAFALELVAAERLVAIGINSPAAFSGVEQNDLVDAGFTTEEAQDILARVTKASV